MPKKVTPELMELVAKAASEGGAQTAPHLSELIEHFFRLMGGPVSFAKEMVVEWHAAKPGSLIRMRILETILRSTRAVNEMQGVGDNTGILDDEDLEREMRSAVETIGK